MLFDLLLWVWVFILLIGLICVFEVTLSSLFGYIILLCSGIFFCVYFIRLNLLFMGVLFAVLSLLAIRYFFSEMKYRKR